MSDQIPQGLLELATIQKDTVYAEKLVEHYRPDFEKALAYELVAGHLAFEPFLAAVKEDVANSARLAEAVRASPGTLISALLLAAQCKLLPGSKYGLLYLIPRRNKGRPEVCAQIGYKGLCTMSTRHKRVHSVEAFLVYKGEQFDYDAGVGRLTHKVDLFADHAEENIIGGYMRAIITEESSQHAVTDAPIYYAMSRADILKRRAVSDAWQRAERNKTFDSPWHQWPDMMFRKTILVGGLNHGSVPRDMGVGGILQADAEADMKPEALSPPKPTQQAQMRSVLGIDKEPEKEPFVFVEEAVSAIKQAKTVHELEAMAGRWQHFKDYDAEQIGMAYEDREKELGS